MIIAKINVNGTIAHTVFRKDIPAGIIGAQIEFEYDKDVWSGLHKTVVFRGPVSKDVITDANIITIPPEVAEKALCQLRVGVYGVDADGNLAIPTILADLGIVRESASPSGDTTTDPSLPVWAQIQSMIGNLDELETTARENLVAAVNEAMTKCGGSVDEAEIRRIVDAYLAENPPAQGPPGKSAYELAVANGYTGSETDLLASLHGTDGDDGKTPEYGVDYGTPEQISGIAQQAAELLKPNISQLKDDLDAETRRAKEAEANRIKKFYTSNLGATGIADSDDGAVRNLVIGGRCKQGDNPSPDNPQEIKCVEGCTMTVSSADGTKRQEAEIPVTLRGIGDVRDELYVYADGTGKLVQRIKHRIITVDDDIFVSGMSTKDYTNFGIRSIADLAPQYTNGFANIISNRFTRSKRQMFNVQNTVFPGGNKNDILYFCVSAELARSPDDFRTFCANNQVYVLYEINQIETVLTAEQTKALSNLRTHYGGTNITYASDNGVEPVVNFDYACALEAFVEHVKTQQGDTREMIYNMDDRLESVEVAALEAAIDAQIAQAMMEV